jgi:hypothetical protein
MKQLLLFSTIILTFLCPVLSYSQVDKVDETRTYFWDTSAMPADWKLNSTRQFTYNNGGNKETNLLVLDADDNKLTQTKKSYNASNNITLAIEQFWNNSPPMAWQDFSQIIYDYYGSGNLMSETKQSYVSMAWQNTSKIEYEYYDGTDNLKRKTTLYYNPGTMMFEITASSNQELYEYIGDDITKQTFQDWVPGSGWFSDYIFESSYSSPGVQSGYLESSWNGSMYDIERATFTYDAGLITKIEYEIPDGLGGWSFNGQSLFAYPSPLITEITQQDENSENEFRDTSTSDANGNIIVTVDEEWVSGMWVQLFKIENDFTAAVPFSLSSESFSKVDFKVYPNPASNVINIASSKAIDKIEIFDVLGKKVLMTTETKQIDVQGLKSGVYLFKVFNDNNSSVKRIVVE